MWCGNSKNINKTWLDEEKLCFTVFVLIWFSPSAGRNVTKTRSKFAQIPKQFSGIIQRASYPSNNNTFNESLVIYTKAGILPGSILGHYCILVIY